MKGKIPEFYRHYLTAAAKSYEPTPSSGKECLAACKEALKQKDDIRVRRIMSSVLLREKDGRGFLENARILAEKDSPEAYGAIGRYYADDKDGERDYSMAIRYFEEGIKKGSTYSYLGLALLYKEGKGVIPSEETYLRLLKEGARKRKGEYLGSIHAELGKHYMMKEDYASSLKEYRKAASYGDHDANRMIAHIYRYGLGVRKNLSRYMDYLSSNPGPEAALEIASVYLRGEIAEKDVNLAVYYLYGASFQGSKLATAMNALLASKEKGANKSTVTLWLRSYFDSPEETSILDKLDRIEELFGPFYRSEMENLLTDLLHITPAEA